MLNARKPFRVLFGPILDGLMGGDVVSFSSADLILNVGDESITIDTWTQVGTDNSGAYPEACFVAEFSISVPTDFTVLSWSATQGSNSDNGRVPTKPGMYDDFRLLLGTCNLIEYTNSGYGDDPHHGIWPLAQQLIEDSALPPVVAYCHHDDIIYSDTLQVNDTGFSGKITTGQPHTTLLRFDYAMTYCAGFFGLCGNVDDPFGACQGGLIPGLQYVLGNARFFPGWGNHEFGHNIGLAAQAGGTLGAPRPNEFHSTGTAGVDFTGDGAGRVVYNQLFKPLHGQSLPIPRDTDANHYYEDFGPVRLISTDVITRHSGDALTTVFGNNQIDDVLEMADTEQPFKFILFAHGTRPWSDNTTAFKTLSPNYQNDYDRLLLNTGQSPQSLMDNPWTNGIYGSFTFVHADHHRGAVRWHYAPAGTGKAREHFLSVQLGTATRLSGLHGLPGFATGEDDTVGQIVAEYSSDSNTAGPHLLELIVYGSEAPPRVHLRLWKESSTLGSFEIADERHIVQHHGNRGRSSPDTPKHSVLVDL